MSNNDRDNEVDAVNTSNKPNIYVYERDIDLLLLEEFYSTPAFQSWFAACVAERDVHKKFKADNVQFLKAEHSVADDIGESDLVVTYQEANKQTWLLMLENKINAPFQKDQAERYTIRGQKELDLKPGIAVGFTTVLVAPEKYFGDSITNFGFDARITYQELQAWFKEKEELGQRRYHKVWLLDTAIHRPRIRVTSEIVTNFCRSYWLFAQENLPELKMKEPKLRAPSSTWIEFRLPNNSTESYIVHKMGEGKVDLHFNDMAQRLDGLKARFSPYLEKDMNLCAAGKSGAIGLSVPPLKINQPFEEQKEAALFGMKAVLRLRGMLELEQASKSAQTDL